MGRKKVVQRMIDDMKSPKPDLRRWWEVGCVIEGKWEKFVVHAMEWETVGNQIVFMNEKEKWARTDPTCIAMFREWNYVIEIKNCRKTTETQDLSEKLESLKQTCSADDLPKNWGKMM